MVKFIRVALFLVLLALCSTCSVERKELKKVEVRGVYGTPKPLWDKGYQLNELGVNAVFTHSGSINTEMAQRVKVEGAKLFAEFATLNGKNYVDKHPDAWVINEKGEKVAAASWFMGVCPNNAAFKQYRFDQLKQLLNDSECDGY